MIPVDLIGERVTVVDDDGLHRHGVVDAVRSRPRVALVVRFDDKRVEVVDYDDDVLSDSTRCAGYTALGPCSDQADPGDELCPSCGGCVHERNV